MTRSPAGVMTPISLAEQILRAYSTGPNPDHGGTLGFLGGPEKRIGYEFMVDLTELRRAAIHVRAHYDQYIGNLAIPKVCSILHDYVILLFDRGLDTNLSIFLAQRRPARLVQYLSASALVTANILLGEIIEHKSDKSITIFPCRNIAIDIDLIAGNFAILSHNSDLSIITAFHKNNHQLLPGKFPPIHWDGSTHRLSCHDSIAGVITHCPDFPAKLAKRLSRGLCGRRQPFPTSAYAPIFYAESGTPFCMVVVHRYSVALSTLSTLNALTALRRMINSGS